MESNSRQGNAFWGHLPSNMNGLPARLRDQRVQQHLGQVMRGVIPGAGPQPEYHPNPYLQHLYHGQSGSTGGNEPRGDHSDIDFELGALEAQLQEVISQRAAVNIPAENGQNNNTEDNAHGHSHRPDGRRERLDWKLILGSASFGIILLLRLLADHLLGILVFIGLSLVFYYANSRMIEIVHVTSLREGHNKGRVLLSGLWLVVFLLLQIAGIYWFFEEQQLWKVFLWQLPTSWQGSLFDLFWVSVITDHVVRFATVAVKCIVAISPAVLLPQKKKGRCYMFIEIATQMFRMTLPIIPWLHFLYDQPTSGKLIFSALLAVIYLILKGWTLFLEYFKVVKAFRMLLVDTKFGAQPTLEEIKSRGENCPICQDDYQDPVMLSCKHIFCENCVSIWFDREKTCPMCRAEIQSDSPVWQDGSTSAHLQWY